MYAILKNACASSPIITCGATNGGRKSGKRSIRICGWEKGNDEHGTGNDEHGTRNDEVGTVD
jgi:hypothetical protein